MGYFNDTVTLQPLPDGHNWKVVDPVIYVDDAREVIAVPAGFTTDLASVPRLFWAIIPPFGKYDGAAIVHDYLYSTQIYTRAKSDGILLEAMKAEGVSAFERWVIYSAVRSFGWIPWGNRGKELVHE